jgi:hypothetical protein
MRKLDAAASNGSASAGILHVAIVYGIRHIHFVAVAESRDALRLRIADYVRSQAETQLYEEDTWVLSRLLERENLEPAIRYYFEHVGERWDREWLDEGTVSAAAGEAVPA